jgi:hypothetical protein
MDQSQILDHPPHVLHSLSLPAAMPPGMGEGGGVKKGPPHFNDDYLFYVPLEALDYSFSVTITSRLFLTVLLFVSSIRSHFKLCE